MLRGATGRAAGRHVLCLAEPAAVVTHQRAAHWLDRPVQCPQEGVPPRPLLQANQLLQSDGTAWSCTHVMHHNAGQVTCESLGKTTDRSMPPTWKGQVKGSGGARGNCGGNGVSAVAVAAPAPAQRPPCAEEAPRAQKVAQVAPAPAAAPVRAATVPAPMAVGVIGGILLLFAGAMAGGALCLLSPRLYTAASAARVSAPMAVRACIGGRCRW